MEQRHWGVLCCLLRGKGLGITALSWFGEFVELLLSTLGACREGMGPGRAKPTREGQENWFPGSRHGTDWLLLAPHHRLWHEHGFGVTTALAQPWPRAVACCIPHENPAGCSTQGWPRPPRCVEVLALHQEHWCPAAVCTAAECSSQCL